MISKSLIFFFCFIFGVTLFVPPVALSQKASPTILDFRIQAMYRAAKLTWKVKGDLKNEMAVQILRADTFEDAAYNEAGVVKIIPGKSSYEYIDKSMGAEAKYYYKLIIKETDETFGPLSTRPYFSPPAT
jgi:hypothetical protein